MCARVSCHRCSEYVNETDAIKSGNKPAKE
jgi:hypothetical protein